MGPNKADQFGYFDYVKAAFNRRQRVPLLGALPLNYLGIAAFGVLGLLNPGFWFLGAAAETAWVLGLAGNDRFQALVRAERQLEHKATWQQRVEEALSRLSPASRDRYHRLLVQCRQALGQADTLSGGDTIASMREQRTGGLNQILWIFLRLLGSREMIEQNLSRVDRATLVREIANLEKRLATVDDDSQLARSLRGSLDIQRKRMENLKRAEESAEVLDAELERIEHQVVLIREEAAISGKAEILSDRLDSVSNALTETHRWMEANARIFSELGADPLGSAPPDLPQVSIAAETES